MVLDHCLFLFAGLSRFMHIFIWFHFSTRSFLSFALLSLVICPFLILQDEGWKQTLACIFSYITHLIKFKDKHSMDGFSSAKHHKIPSILSLKFSDMFVDSDSKRLSDEKRDLVISYILVLTLFADDFKTDPADIARDLRMSSIKLRPHFEHLGCKLVREGTLSMVKLALPLKFPMLRRRRRRG